MFLVLLETFSSVIFDMFIPSEKPDVLRQALIQLGTHSLCALIRVSSVRG